MLQKPTKGLVCASTVTVQNCPLPYPEMPSGGGVQIDFEHEGKPLVLLMTDPVAMSLLRALMAVVSKDNYSCSASTHRINVTHRDLGNVFVRSLP